eukprot:COSAG06_NODE_2980_length_5991_cov_13.295655_4_plen_140_part_00
MLTEELQTHSILPAVGRFGLCCWLGCVVVTLGSCLLPFWVLFVYCPLSVDSRVLLVCCLLCVCVALISCLACLVTLISCLACLLSAVCCLLSAVCMVLVLHRRCTGRRDRCEARPPAQPAAAADGTTKGMHLTHHPHHL